MEKSHQNTASLLTGIDSRRSIFHRPLHWMKVTLGSTLLSLLATLGSAHPAIAAEQIYISFGLLERTIFVDSLEEFARTGQVNSDLAEYLSFVNDEQLQQFQDFLLTRAEVSPVAVAQFLYTAQGETLLEQLGEIIRTESRQSGAIALRAALILAAADTETGLTPLNVLRYFPLDDIRIDVERTLEITRELEQLINQTNQAIGLIEQQSALEAAEAPLVDFSQLPDLRQPGTFSWERRTLEIEDSMRKRTFRADLYLPLTVTGEPPPFPVSVIVISHGLGSDRNTYTYLAQHLASYGFAVAVPEHPGSNTQQLLALIAGRSNEVVDPNEFVDRPLDVRHLLDELEARSQTDPQFQGRLNLEQVGVIGQSFGGYTVLALAGGQINFNKLQRDCSAADPLNLSLLLQCRALELAPPIAELHDDRIQAIIAINPVGSSLLGETGFRRIEVPVMVVTGNADTIAPSLLEQIYPFTWLGSDSRYLVLLRGATHFSTIGESPPDSGAVSLPPQIVGPDPTLARRYLNALSVAFMETYVNSQESYQVYLESSYARYISQSTLPLRLVQSLSPIQLAERLQAEETEASAQESLQRRSPTSMARWDSR